MGNDPIYFTGHPKVGRTWAEGEGSPTTITCVDESLMHDGILYSFRIDRYREERGFWMKPFIFLSYTENPSLSESHITFYDTGTFGRPDLIKAVLHQDGSCKLRPTHQEISLNR